MKILFETQRTLVRDLMPEQDANQLFAIYSDREIMRFLSTPAAESIEEVRDRLEQRVKFYKELDNGTGLWAVVERASEEIVGVILLKALPDNSGVPTQNLEIGWHFRRSHWGHGFATEAAKRILTYGFETLQLPAIYAVVRPENERSRRVTERLGMKPLGRTNEYYGAELLLFVLFNPNERSKSNL
jgi:[ribosomal protein S5]-alanine N-acetyltransferase